MTGDDWDELLKVQRILLGDVELATGPVEIDVTREIVNSMARLTVLLDMQAERIKLMELGHNYTMVSRWVKLAAKELHSLGQGSFGIMKVLRKLGY